MFIDDPWIEIGIKVADKVTGMFTLCARRGVVPYGIIARRWDIDEDEVEFMCNSKKWQVRAKPSVKWVNGDFEDTDKTSVFIAKEMWGNYWERHFIEDPNSKTTITTCPTLPEFIDKDIWESYEEIHFTEDPNSKIEVTTYPILRRCYHKTKIDDFDCYRCNHL